MRQLVKPMDLSTAISLVYSYKLELMAAYSAKKHRNIMIAIIMKKMESRRSRVDWLD